MKISNVLFAAVFVLFIFGNLTLYGQKKDVSMKGIVERIIFEENPTRDEYFLSAENGNRYRLSASKSLAVYANRRVSLAGALDGSQFSVKGEIRLLEENKTFSAPPPTFGSRKVLVILTKLSDSPPPLETVEDARAQIFTGEKSVNQYFKEASLNRFNLTGVIRPDGDITDWLTLPFSVENCNPSIWAPSASTLARQNGYEPNNYNSVIFVFPTLCGQNPSASLGTLGYDSGSLGVWISSGILWRVDVMAHELGHNLGLMHANGIRCPGTSIPNGCQQIEYGDPYDVMGMGRLSPFFFNNFSRLGLGWLTGRVNEITASGDFSLAAPSAPAKGNQVLQVPLKNGDGNLTGYSYYLEFRRRVGFDNQPGPFFQPLFDGIGIRFAPTDYWGIGSMLVDTTPNTPAYEDAPLAVGQTYTDLQHGLTIKTLSTNPQFGARVRIQLSR